MLGKDEAAAKKALGEALALVRESWESETTLRNLRLIRETREQRGDAAPWTVAVEKALEKKANP